MINARRYVADDHVAPGLNETWITYLNYSPEDSKAELRQGEQANCVIVDLGRVGAPPKLSHSNKCPIKVLIAGKSVDGFLRRRETTRSTNAPGGCI